jgi:hypothetical protein
MRFFYFILFITLQYSLRIFYPRIKIINSPKKFFGRTIYVSNHAASFMDPLVIGGLRMPILFFMTRSDVFTRFTRPFLWAAHMIPIYRQHDGVDTKNANEKVFEKCNKVLSFGRNLLVFGEGFTDDVFIRRLKPVKKGAVRIGFGALDSMQWKKKVYIAAIGCNYSDPNEMRSDLLIATSNRICLNDYRESYQNNPVKTITEVTKLLEKLMRDQITHVENKDWCEFHENVMKLTRKGMNARHRDTKIPLVTRWHYSQKLANWLNTQTENQLEQLSELKHEMNRYFSLLKKLRIHDNYVHESGTSKQLKRGKELLLLVVLAPVAVLGLIHCGIPYFLIKRFVEKSFKRPVFWGSVKLLLGMILIGLLNIPVIFLFHDLIYASYWLGFLYYASIGLYGLSAYMWFRNLERFREKGLIRKLDLANVLNKRALLMEEIHRKIPVA